MSNQGNERGLCSCVTHTKVGGLPLVITLKFASGLGIALPHWRRVWFNLQGMVEPLIVLSHLQTAPLLHGRDQGLRQVESSVDLGLSTAVIHLASDHITLPDGQTLTWGQVEEIQANDTNCFLVQKNTIEKIKFFSETTNRAYSLMPTDSAPTMLVAGFPMHRIKGTNPYKDTQSKIRAAKPVSGQVLDCTMGLGYTAIETAKFADQVTTIELDPTVTAVCRHNPWSQALFDNPKISRLIGDAYEVVPTFADGRFNLIMHDPPTFSLAGHLYSAEFYEELYRVLTPKGRLFHYIGNPDSKSGGNVTRGVVRRLQEVGFRRVIPKKGAFGVLALK